jgi:hypothetical protein
MAPRAVAEAQFVTALVGDSTSSDVNKEDVDYSYILLRGRIFPIRQFLIPPSPTIRCFDQIQNTNTERSEVKPKEEASEQPTISRYVRTFRAPPRPSA